MTPDILIRRAAPLDVPEILGLWHALQQTSARYEPRLAPSEGSADWFAEFLRDQLDNEDARFFVAVGDEGLVGYVFGQVFRRPTLASGDCGYVADLVVAESWRGRGVGRRLFQTLREWFRARGLTAIEVQVVRANPASQAFWRKMGFTDFLRTLRSD